MQQLCAKQIALVLSEKRHGKICEKESDPSREIRATASGGASDPGKLVSFPAGPNAKRHLRAASHCVAVWPLPKQKDDAVAARQPHQRLSSWQRSDKRMISVAVRDTIARINISST